jgi:hypothetical protein
MTAVNRENLERINDVLEEIGFGRREATREHFETTLTGYEAGFRATGETIES